MSALSEHREQEAAAPVAPPCPRSPLRRLLPRGPLLRRSDQLGLALLLAVAMVLMVLGWYRSGGFSGHLVDADSRLAETTSQAQARYLVDINTADVGELGELPQVGPTLARRLIEHREQHGRFRSFDDLMRVKGIGPKTLEGLRPHVRFE